MYLKKIMLLISFFGFLYIFSMSAHAAPTEEKDAFFDVFEIDEKQVVEDTEDEAFGLYERDQDGKNKFVSVKDSNLENNNDFGIFSLSKGFSRAAVATFSDTKSLTGKGEFGTTIGYLVFTVSDNHQMKIGNQGFNKIGVTGIFNKQVQFQIGDNYILVAVKNDDYFVYRLFKVSVKKEETRGLLENIEVNFIPTTPEVTVPVPSKPIMGLN